MQPYSRRHNFAQQYEVVEHCMPEISSVHWDTIIRRWRDDGRGILRYLAEAMPERVWQQLSLEQVPIKGAP